MTDHQPKNFSISPEAVDLIRYLRNHFDERDGTKSGVASIAWGDVYKEGALVRGGDQVTGISGEPVSSNVVVGYFWQNQYDEIKEFIVTFQGEPVVFGNDPVTMRRLDNKVLDVIDGNFGLKDAV